MEVARWGTGRIYLRLHLKRGFAPPVKQVAKVRPAGPGLARLPQQLKYKKSKGTIFFSLSSIIIHYLGPEKMIKLWWDSHCCLGIRAQGSKWSKGAIFQNWLFTHSKVVNA